MLEPRNSPETGEDDSPPFRVQVREQSSPASGIDVHEAAGDDSLSMDEIEAAYLRALETADVAEAVVAAELSIGAGEAGPPIPSRETPLPSVRLSHPESAAGAADPSPAPVAGATVSSAIDPLQILEAFLFVGGDPLPTKKLLDLLGNSFSAEQLDHLLEQLNRRYLGEKRPYEIRLHEGGYRLQLRDEFESVRRKVYGQGPREVKLAQETLEILALIAYRQPVSREQLDATERPNIPATLRQLLRRELIQLQRDWSVEGPQGELYRTTGRFLELFGLASLHDLPLAADFSFK